MHAAGLPANLGLLPRAAASRFRERLALIDVGPDGERQLSFMQLADRCDRLSKALLVRGMKSGERVVIFGHNRLEFVEAVFGVLRAGLVAVPVDERIGAYMMESICKSCQPKAIIAVGENSAATAMAASVAIPVRMNAGRQIADWENYHALLDDTGDASVGALTSAGPGNAPALIMHTSGSTGFPKGVTLSHQAAMSGIRRNQPVGPDGEIKDIRQKSLLVLPLGHEAAFSALKYMLAYGGTTILDGSFRAPEFLHVLAKYRCTHTLLVPAMAILVLKELELLRTLDLSALQSIVIGSAACSPDLLRSLTEAFPTAVITQNYGLTECGQILAQSYTRSGRAPFTSVGKPVRGVEVKLDGGGDAGELWVKTPAMMSGPDNGVLSASSFVDGWLRTGDVFSKDADGYFYFQGRKDDMFSCGGMNIFPLEIEKTLCRHPDVLDACVVAISHDIKGQVPVAMVVLKSGAALSSDALMTFYLEYGAAYARPRQICFVSELPVGATGKIDRDAVRKALETGAVEESSR